MTTAVTWLPTTRPPAAADSSDYVEWEDPRCFGVGKEPAHATLFGCESRELALGAGRTASSRFLSLNGTWRSPYTNVMWVDLRWARSAPLAALRQVSLPA